MNQPHDRALPPQPTATMHAAAPDSTATHHAAQSTSAVYPAAPLTEFHVTDSLMRATYGNAPVKSAAKDGNVEPEAIFGTASTPGSTVTQLQTGTTTTARKAGATHPFSVEPVYQICTLLILAGYCVMLCYFRSSVASLVKMLRSKIYTEKLLDETNHTFAVFLNMALGMWLGATGITVIRYAETVDPAGFARLPAWVAALAAPTVVVLMWVITIYQGLVLRVAGNLTLDRGFTDRLWYLRKLSLSLGTLALLPALALAALNTSGTQIAALWLAITTATATLVFMYYKTYMLFADQKISILHWFLYLCTVEIFPVSLVAALLGRIYS